MELPTFIINGKTYQAREARLQKEVNLESDPEYPDMMRHYTTGNETLSLLMYSGSEYLWKYHEENKRVEGESLIIENAVLVHVIHITPRLPARHNRVNTENYLPHPE